MRWALFAGLALCLLTAWPGLAAATAAPPALAGRAALLMDANTGQVLFAQNPDARAYPASTTKVLTALLAAESGRLDEPVQAGPDASGVEGTSCYLQVGETHPLRDLVNCLMVASGNDAAVAIADHLAGSAAAFAEQMNQRAQQAGAVHSHFANPHGLHSPNHYTTALDLARIARAAFANPVVREAGALRRFTLTGPEGPREFLNRNALIWETPGVVTGKIGFTEEAGHTLVVLAERDGLRLLAVILGYQHQGWMFQHAEDLLNWGFATFRPQVLVAQGAALGQVPVRGGTAPAVPAVAATGLQVLAPAPGGGAPHGGPEPDGVPAPGGTALVGAAAPAAGAGRWAGDLGAPPVRVEVDLPAQIEAPVAAGQVLGAAVVRQGDQELGRATLVAGAAVPEPALAALAWHRPTWPLAMALAAATLASLLTRRRVRPRRRPPAPKGT